MITFLHHLVEIDISPNLKYVFKNGPFSPTIKEALKKPCIYVVVPTILTSVKIPICMTLGS